MEYYDFLMEDFDDRHSVFTKWAYKYKIKSRRDVDDLTLIASICYRNTYAIAEGSITNSDHSDWVCEPTVLLEFLMELIYPYVVYRNNVPNIKIPYNIEKANGMFWWLINGLFRFTSECNEEYWRCRVNDILSGRYLHEELPNEIPIDASIRDQLHIYLEYSGLLEVYSIPKTR